MGTYKAYTPQTGIGGDCLKPERRVGYCWSSIHRGYLSSRDVKKHNCIGKNCARFQKFEDMPYWTETERARLREYRRHLPVKKLAAAGENRLEIARTLTRDNPDIWITSVGVQSSGVLRVSYIGYREEDLSEFARDMREMFGLGVYLRWSRSEYETLEYLLDKKRSESAECEEERS